MVSKKFTLYLDAETNDWKFYEHDPYDFFQPSSLGFFADETAYVHESLGPFQGIYSSTDGVAWTKLENSPSNANLTQFEAFDGYMTYFDNYAFDDSVGTHLSADGGVTSTYLQADREGFFIATDYFSDRQNKEVITALYTATDIIIETYDLKTKETTEEVFTTEQTITSATPNTIT